MTAPGIFKRGRLGRIGEVPLARHLAWAVLAAVALYFVTGALSSYQNTEVAEIAWYAVAVAGLSLLTGVSGQISLGHGAFMAIGAYGVGLMTEHFDLPLIVPIVVGTGAAALLGAVFGLPATRLKGPYLAGVTLALALAVQDLPDRFSSLFNGDSGIIVNPPTPPGSIQPERWLAWICLIAAIGTMVVLGNFLKSRYGRALKAVRDDEIAAAAAGLHPARLRVLAFVVSSAAAGLGGALLAFWGGIVSPDSFSLFLSIQLLAGMVIGGAGTLTCAWWGALALVYLPQWTSSVSNHFSSAYGVAANLQNAVFGLVIVVVMLLAPTGIQGWLSSAWRRITGRGPGNGLAAGLTVQSTAIETERTIP